MVSNNIVLNNVLCYISTARNTLPNDEIVTAVISYYNQDEITKARNYIFQLYKKQEKRRQGENRLKNMVQDILDLFVTIDNEDLEIPKFVADSFDALPPVTGFSAVARHISALMDAVSALQIEVSQLKQAKESEIKSKNDTLDSKQDIADIKCMLLNMNAPKGKNTLQPSFDKNLAPQQTYAYSSNASASTSRSLPQVGNAQRSKNSNFNQAINLSSSTNSPQLAANEARVSQSNQRRDVTGSRTNQLNQRKDVTGSRPIEPNDLLASAPERIKQYDLFITNCNKNKTKTEVIMEYCKDKLNIEALACVDLSNKNNNYKSFKLSVAATDRDKLLDPEVWPQGIVVKKFYNFRRWQQFYIS